MNFILENILLNLIIGSISDVKIFNTRSQVHCEET